MTTDFSGVTEVPGNAVTEEALSMLYTRYRFTVPSCEGKDVLEVACGSGQGLGYLAKTARRVVGGDYTRSLLDMARAHYRGRLPLLQLDAQALPFRSSSFDIVLLYEAIYYLPRPERFLDECRRVLREKGVLVLCTVNKEWPDFNPSPFSTRYFTASELEAFLRAGNFHADLFMAFPSKTRSLRDALISWIKRTAVALHLIPKTMKGKAWLKRLFLGPLRPVPTEVHEGMAAYSEPVPIASCQACSGYKVLFAVARPFRSAPTGERILETES